MDARRLVWKLSQREDEYPTRLFGRAASEAGLAPHETAFARELLGGVLRRENPSAKDVGEEVGRRAGAVVGEAVDAAKEQITSSSSATRPPQPSHAPFESTGTGATPKSAGTSRRVGGM